MDSYATKMRLALSDHNIRKSDGSINHQYFLVKKGQFWSEEMQEQLIEHIQKDGVGNWKAYQKGSLEHVSEVEIELRTCLALKISDLSEYQNKKLSKNEIETIANTNYEKGQSINKLKYGIYIM